MPAVVIERFNRNAGSFVAHHVLHLHPPYGLWRVFLAGKLVGQQLSHPSLEDCERMLALATMLAPPAAPPATARDPNAIRRARGAESLTRVNRARRAKGDA